MDLQGVRLPSEKGDEDDCVLILGSFVIRPLPIEVEEVDGLVVVQGDGAVLDERTGVRGDVLLAGVSVVVGDRVTVPEDDEIRRVLGLAGRAPAAVPGLLPPTL